MQRPRPVCEGEKSNAMRLSVDNGAAKEKEINTT